MTLNSYVPSLIDSLYNAGESRATTADWHASMWRNHIEPMLGAVRLNELTTPMIREWNAKLRADKGADLAAKTYRVPRRFLNIAVAVELIPSNPCNIKKAGQERLQSDRLQLLRR